MTQNRESYRRVLGNDDTVDALLANLQCKFFCQNSGETNTWAAEKILGERYVYIDSEGNSYSSQGDSGSLSNQTSEQRRAYVEASDFATLRRGGEANNFIVETIVYNGGYQFYDEQNGEDVPFKLLRYHQLDTE